MVQRNRKINKVMLMSPRYTLYKNDVRRCVSPLGLAYIAAFIEKKGYEVCILDVSAEGHHNTIEEGNFVSYGLSDDEIRKRILEFCPDIVGVSCIFSSQYENAKRLLEIIKSIEPSITTVMGGSHPTYTIKETLDDKNIDFIVIGEGELTMTKLLQTLNDNGDITKINGIAFREEGRVFINRNIEYIADLDQLPFSARHLLNMELYFKINLPQSPYPKGKRVAQILTSRGCPAKCIFCTTTNFWGNRYRGRSAKSVVEEIEMLNEKYGVDEIQFTDDNLTLNKNRATQIIVGIKHLGLSWCVPQGVAVWALDEELLERMRESGCYQLTFAIESGNQHVLDHIVKKPLKLHRVSPLVKKAQSLGIKVHGFFVCGLPGETIEQMHQTYDFAKSVGFDSASFFVATPLVGSELLEICRRENYLKENASYQEQLYKIGNINTPDFTSTEVEQLVREFNRKYNEADTREKRFKSWKY